MIFNKVLGIQRIDIKQTKIKSRKAVRAVIIQNDKLLMVHTNKGDYKFPGGGVQKGENFEHALKRELQEETGCIIQDTKKMIGIIKERKVDSYEKDAIFEMTSNYYLCDISEEQTLQKLDDYEAQLDFSPVWISLEDAIKINEKETKKEDKNPWVERETIVLREIKKIKLDLLNDVNL